jgi:hypothetical protein
MDALAAYGLLHSEWLPGIPGNNKVRQAVEFDEDGPLLIIGNSSRVRPKGPRLTIVRETKGRYLVEMKGTEEDKNRVGALRLKKNVADSAASDGGPALAMTPKHAQIVCCNWVDSAIAWITNNMAGTGCAYTPESLSRIHKSYEELRRAFADGCIVSVSPVVPRYQSVGNVICWPGRGSVAPIAPILLQQ